MWAPGLGCPTMYGTLPTRWHANTTTANWKPGLGLDHFEGRNFTGWHRHATLAVLAQACCTMRRTRLGKRGADEGT